MPTGSKVTNIFVKKLLSKTDLEDRLVQYFQDRIEDIVSSIFAGQSGVVDEDQITVSVGASNNQFTLGLSSANKVATGDGVIITLPDAVQDETEDVSFENNGSDTYYIGVRYAQPIAQEVEVNARTGQPEYPALEDSFGELGNPDSVVDSAGVQIHLVIDGLLENGVDHSGRKVVVYLETPVSGVVGTAFFTGFVTYDGGSGENRVVIPYSGSNGPLGQDTSVDPPSTTAADYVVHVRGASWFKNTDIRTDPTYAFLAIATAGSPPTFNLADQQPIFQQSLDRAYDGLTGAGSGRSIVVDSGAVRLRTSSGSGDDFTSSLTVDRDADSSTNEIAQQNIGGMNDGAMFAALRVVEDGGTNLATQAGIDITDADTITLNPVSGQDFTTVGSGVDPNTDLAKITQSSGGDDGLYRIAAVTATTLDLLALDGTAPGLSGSGTGLLTVLRPVLFAGGELAPEPISDVAVIGSHVTGGAALNVHPGGRDKAVSIYNPSNEEVMQFIPGGADAMRIINTSFPTRYLELLTAFGEATISTVGAGFDLVLDASDGNGIATLSAGGKIDIVTGSAPAAKGAVAQDIDIRSQNDIYIQAGNSAGDVLEAYANDRITLKTHADVSDMIIVPLIPQGATPDNDANPNNVYKDHNTGDNHWIVDAGSEGSFSIPPFWPDRMDLTTLELKVQSVAVAGDVTATLYLLDWSSDNTDASMTTMGTVNDTAINNIVFKTVTLSSLSNNINLRKNNHAMWLSVENNDVSNPVHLYLACRLSVDYDNVTPWPAHTI